MDLYWLQGRELERLPAFASSLAIGLLIGPERERANIVFKLGMVLVVGGRRLFARCAGSMAAVAAGSGRRIVVHMTNCAVCDIG